MQGLGFAAYEYEVCDRHGSAFLFLDLGRHKHFTDNDGPWFGEWETALNALVVDCWQIARGDPFAVAELVGLRLSTLPYYDNCSTPEVTHVKGKPRVWVCFGDRDLDSTDWKQL